MTIEQNRTLAQRYMEELWNQGKLDVAGELLADDYVVHDPGTPGRQGGVEGEQQAVSLYRSAFPDLHFTLEDVVVEGDRVALRWNSSGTHLGELMGMLPTGRRAGPTGLSIFRVVNGRIAENWHNWDTFGMLQQLGAIPTAA